MDQQRFNSCTVNVYQASSNATKILVLLCIVHLFVAVDIDVVDIDIVVAVWKLVKAWAWAYCNTGRGRIVARGVAYALIKALAVTAQRLLSTLTHL